MHGCSLCSNSLKLIGHIYCRLLPESQEIRELGKLLRTKLGSSNDIYFVIQEEHRGQEAQTIHITTNIISDMIQAGNFKMKVHITLSTKLATTEIFLCLGNEGIFPISRFPRSLLENDHATPSELIVHLSV